jgi:6,7-dimethyl-8-ribityllumazine synthase
MSQKIAIVVSRFNEAITKPMLEECLRGFEEQNIEASVHWVPGAWEIPLMCQHLIDEKKADAIVTLGCIILGETDHYQAVSEGVTQALMSISIKRRTPIAFEVLMTDTYQKAEARIEKGYHAAFVATEMLKATSS